jgi:hypothetical protein
MSVYIDSVTSKAFPQPAINMGYVFMLFSPVFVLDKALISIALFLSGLLLSFSVSGLRIDLEKKRFKEYNRYFGFKFGTWLPLNDFPFVTLIASQESSVAFSFKKDDTENDETIYGIYLLNRERSKKVLIKKFQNQDEAILYLPEIAAKTGLKVIS